MNTKKHNMSYLGLNSEQYDKHCRLMGMKMSKWPDSLYNHVKQETQRVGVCGDAVACAVASWLKEQGK